MSESCFLVSGHPARAALLMAGLTVAGCGGGDTRTALSMAGATASLPPLASVGTLRRAARDRAGGTRSAAVSESPPGGYGDGGPTAAAVASAGEIDPISRAALRFAGMASMTRIRRRAPTTPLRVVGYGSGLLVGTGGIMVTSHHVVDNCTRLLTFWRGRRSRAEVIAENSASDLALLRTRLPNTSTARLKSGAGLQVGNAVWAVGFPNAFHQRVPSSHRGRVSDPRPSSFDIGRLPRSVVELEMVSAIAPGMSGGAIIGRDGAVVAITTAINARFGNTGFGVKADGVFALAQRADITLGGGDAERDVRNVAVTVACMAPREG